MWSNRNVSAAIPSGSLQVIRLLKNSVQRANLRLNHSLAEEK